MDKYHHIVEAQGDDYVVDTWHGTAENDLSNRHTVAKAALPLSTGPGSVLVVVEGSIRSPEEATFEAAEEATAAAVRSAHESAMAPLREAAAEYGVDLADVTEEITDGDVLLGVRPSGDAYLDTVAYATPDGLWSEDHIYARSFTNVVACSPSLFEPGMVFDVFEVGERAFGLRYDAERTEHAQSEPVQFTVFPGEIYEFHDDIDSQGDLSRPLYVQMQSFNEGEYYANLKDTPATADGEPSEERRHLISIQATKPYQVKAGWPYPEQAVLPVESIHFEANEWSPDPVVLVSPDAEPVDR